MASKTISIKESTYDRLKALKGSEESFSDAIDRLVGHREGQHPLFELVGLVDETEHDNLRERSGTFRSELNDRLRHDK